MNIYRALLHVADGGKVSHDRDEFEPLYLELNELGDIVGASDLTKELVLSTAWKAEEVWVSLDRDYALKAVELNEVVEVLNPRTRSWNRVVVVDGYPMYEGTQNTVPVIACDQWRVKR